MTYGFKYFSEDQLAHSWSSLSDALNLMQLYWAKTVDLPHLSGDFADLQQLDAFAQLLQEKQPFSRDFFSPGHITGSALILNPNWSKVLLTHHRKLDKWLQLGGHSDDSPDTHLVALREGEEESGLSELSLIALPGNEDQDQVVPFDIDIHAIPARKTEPMHMHYDVRFILIADDNQPFMVSNESNDLKWFTIDEARQANPERSMQRQFDKVEVIKSLFFR